MGGLGRVRGVAGGLVVAGCLVLVAWSGHAGRSWGRARSEYVFDPTRLELGAALPGWLRPPMARALLSGYLQAAGEPFSLLDRAALDRFAGRLRRLDWVKDVSVRPVYPDQLDLRLELRRPVAAAIDAARRLWLYDAEGVRLEVTPADGFDPVAADLVRRASGGELAVLAGPAQLPYGLPLLVGRGRDCAANGNAFGEAAMVAAEAVRELWPALVALTRSSPAELPALLGVDLTPAGIDSGAAEFSLLVRAADGGIVRLGWGHSPRTRYRPIPVADKAAVFALLLGERPGLAGLASADLRFRRRWRDRIELRPPAEPTPAAAAPGSLAKSRD